MPTEHLGIISHPLPCQQGAKKGKKAAAGKKGGKAKASWVGAVAKTDDGCKFYNKAKVGLRQAHLSYLARSAQRRADASHNNSARRGGQRRMHSDCGVLVEMACPYL